MHPVIRSLLWSATARLFRWLTVLLVVVAYIVSVGGPGDARLFGP
jgi:hypothetical protein